MCHSKAARPGCDADEANSRLDGGGGMPAGQSEILVADRSVHREAADTDARNGAPAAAWRGGADQRRTEGATANPRKWAALAERASSLFRALEPRPPSMCSSRGAAPPAGEPPPLPAPCIPASCPGEPAGGAAGLSPPSVPARPISPCRADCKPSRQLCRAASRTVSPWRAWLPSRAASRAVL
eukprot:scaffold25830_cov101-Isochrysis_galbana.AAC.5